MALPDTIEIGRANGTHLSIASAPTGGTLYECWVKPISIYNLYCINITLRGSNWYLYYGISVLSSTSIRTQCQVWQYPNWGGNVSIYGQDETVTTEVANGWFKLVVQVVVGSPNTTFRVWRKNGTAGSMTLLADTSIANSTFTQGGGAAGEVDTIDVGYYLTDSTDNLNVTSARVYATSVAPSLATLEARAASLTADPTAWADWPLTWVSGAADITDHSGNSRALTATGTLYQGAAGPIDSGATFTADVSESVAVSEEEASSLAAGVSVAETVQARESGGPIGGIFQRNVFQNNIFQVFPASGGTTHAADVSESATVSEAITVETPTSSSLTDSETVGDAVSVSVNTAAAVAESGTIGESASAVRTGVIGVSESETSSESASTVALRTVGVSESEAVSEAVAGVRLGSSVQPTVGAHSVTMKTWDGNGFINSPALTTQVSGSTILVAISCGYLEETARVPTDNKGNTYTVVEPSHSYPTIAESGIAVYACANANGGSNHIVSINPMVDNEATLFVVEVRNGGVIQAHSLNSDTSVDLTIPTTSVSATAAATIVAFCFPGGSVSPTFYTTDNSFTVLDEAKPAPNGWIQGASAYREVADPGSYATTFTYDNDQNGLGVAIVVQSSSILYTATLSESEGVSESASPAVTGTAGLSEGETVGESLSTSSNQTYEASVSESVTSGESAGAASTATVSGSETVASAESGSVGAVAAVAGSEAVASTEAAGVATVAVVSAATGTNIIPAMSSNTTPSGVASASSQFAAYHPYLCMRRINDTTGWATSHAANGFPQTVQYDSPVEGFPISYAVTSRNEPGLGRNPKSWQFRASADGGNTYDVLDTRANITDWGNAANIRKQFTVTASKNYTRFQLYITASNDATYVGVGMFEVFVGFTESATVGESTTTAATLFQNVGESEAVGEGSSVSVVASVAPSESEGIAEGVGVSKTYTTTVGESVGSAEGISTSALTATVDETVASGEAGDVGTVAGVVPSETKAVGEAAGVGAVFKADVFEAAGIAEGVATGNAFTASMSETVSSTGTAGATAGASAALGDAVAEGEGVAVATSTAQGLEETVGSSDEVGGAAGNVFSSTVEESVVSVEGVGVSVTAAANVEEPVEVTEPSGFGLGSVIVEGVPRRLTAGWVMVEGVKRQIVSGWAYVGGVKRRLI